MFVSFHLRSNDEIYALRDVSGVGFDRLRFPSGKVRKCMYLIKGNGDMLNFVWSDVCGLLIEDFEGQRHAYSDDAKFISIEDGQPFEGRRSLG